MRIVTTYALFSIAVGLTGVVHSAEGIELFDDFADGDVRDLDPVDWNSPYNCYPLQQSVEGAILLCDQLPLEVFFLANETFRGDVSVRTRVHTVGSGITGCAAQSRLECSRSIWGYEAWVIPRRHWDNPWVQADVALIRGDGENRFGDVGAVLGTHTFPQGLDPREDHFVQLDVRGDFVEVRFWRPDEPFPEEPLIRVQDTTYRSGAAGVTFLYGPGPSDVRNGECENNYGVYDFVWIRDRILGADDEYPSEKPPAGRFRRGDCNDDGTVDISDVVFSLGSLFLGEGDPACDDACDSNDDGRVDISDAIATLGVLFLGQGTIPPPGMDNCGVDPTDDTLSCETAPKNCQ